MPVRLRSAAVLVVVPLLLAGCSGDPESTEPTAPVSSKAPEPTPSTDLPTTEPTETSEPPQTPDTTSAPVPTGTVIEMDGATVTLPQGYEVTTKGRLLTVSSFTPGRNLNLLSITTQSNLGIVDPLAESIKNHNAGQIAYLYPPETLDPVTVDGTDLFHVAGKVNDSQWGEAFGGDTEDFYVDFSFLFDLRYSATERQQIIDTFLTGIELTP